MENTKITVELDEVGNTVSVTLDGTVLGEKPAEELPPGRIIPGADLGKIYRFLEDKKNQRCVKRNCRWY